MSNEPILPILRRAKPVLHIAMSPDGSRVALARTNKVVELWDGHGTLLGWHKVHQQPIAQLAISDDGSQIVSMSEVPRRFFDEALIWDFPNARVKRMDPAGRFPGYQSPQFVPGSREFVVKKRWLYSYDAESGTAASESLSGSAKCDAFAISPNGKLLALGTRSGDIEVREMMSDHIARKLEGHTADVDLLAFSEDGAMLCSLSLDGTCRLWNVETGMEIRCSSIVCDDHFGLGYSCYHHGWILVDGAHGLRLIAVDPADDWTGPAQNNSQINAVSVVHPVERIAVGFQDGSVTIMHPEFGRSFGLNARPIVPIGYPIRRPIQTFSRARKDEHLRHPQPMAASIRCETIGDNVIHSDIEEPTGSTD